MKLGPDYHTGHSLRRTSITTVQHMLRASSQDFSSVSHNTTACKQISL